MENFIKNKIRGFARLVDFGDAISSRTKSTSPKFTTGFTLVETLVALFIFSISVLTVMSVLSTGITSTNYAKNKITAEYLSQEGIEFFRNMRDTYVLSEETPQIGWGKFRQLLIDQCKNQQGCLFYNDESNNSWPSSSIKDMIVSQCNAQNGCDKLMYDDAKGIYGYSGSGSVFTRKMVVYVDGDSDSLNVESTVTWSSGSGTGSVSLSGDLSNWFE